MMFPRAAALMVVSALFVVSAVSAAPSARQTPVVKVVESRSASVVNIGTEQIVLLRNHPFWGAYGANFDTYFGNFYAGAQAMKFPAVGSGVIVGAEGLIITNAHVVNMANRIIVTLADGTREDAVVLGVSQKDDLALIQIKRAKGLRPIPIAKNVLLGETVVAIGNPFGLQNSVSTGVVSGQNRVFSLHAGQTTGELLQTDASINPGSSGGALINLDGELVGINLAIVENAQNIGFAIPAAKVKDMLEAYRKVKSQIKV